jgi:pimeloyl-ACP methyl ester carboxylesterase
MRDLGNCGLERIRVARRGRSVAADLPDELAGGRLQLAGCRRRFGATQGLDASAHGGRVQRLGGTVARMNNWRRRLLPSLTAAVLAGVAGIALALVIDLVRAGSPAAWLARHHLSPPYDARGERFDIGRRELYLDCRGEGSPTVVLEAGSGSDSSTWSAVFDALANTTRTCAYDRAGRGRSDPVERHTLGHAGAELRALLSTAGEMPPLIVVGHSLGGAFGRVFAAENREDIAGLVLVDTFDPDLQEDWIHPLLGPLRPEYDTNLDALRDTVSLVDSLDWPASEAQLREASLAGLPIEVLTAPRYEPRLSEAQNADIATAWVSAYESMSPGLVRHTIAWGAGHLVHIDRPDVVIEAVRRLVDQAGRRRLS